MQVPVRHVFRTDSVKMVERAKQARSHAGAAVLDHGGRVGQLLKGVPAHRPPPNSGAAQGAAPGLPLKRASAALDRNQRRDGTAGHLSGKDRAARRPTKRSPAAGAPTRRRRPGGCQCERKRAITEGVRPRGVVNAAKAEARGALFVVGFSDDRRLVVPVLVLFVFFVLVIDHRRLGLAAASRCP